MSRPDLRKNRKRPNVRFISVSGAMKRRIRIACDRLNISEHQLVLRAVFGTDATQMYQASKDTTP